MGRYRSVRQRLGCSVNEAATRVQRTFETMLTELRMDVRREVMLIPDGADTSDTHRQASIDADLLFRKSRRNAPRGMGIDNHGGSELESVSGTVYIGAAVLDPDGGAVPLGYENQAAFIGMPRLF